MADNEAFSSAQEYRLAEMIGSGIEKAALELEEGVVEASTRAVSNSLVELHRRVEALEHGRLDITERDDGVTQRIFGSRDREEKPSHGELRDLPDTALARSLLSESEEDPWQNRSSGMRCSTCAFYVPKGYGTNPAAPDGDRIELGRCRRRAPTMNGYPVVTPADWCGDHKLK